MSVGTGDWLANEQFDFEVADSPALINNSIGDAIDGEESDEEVFFGPQSHKEKCIATVVKEKEEETKIPVDHLNPEQQALLLRESALVSVRIKHKNTPNQQRKSSPIAIVHPMKRDRPNEPQNEVSVPEEKENFNPVKSKSAVRKGIMTPKKYTNKSKVLQQSNLVNKVRPLSQPDIAQTKLPMARVRGKSNLEMSQDLVDQASLYGLSSGGNLASKPVKRRSGLPLVKRSGVDSNASSQASKPSFLPPSAVPTTRTKLGSNTKNENKESTTKLKPLKALPQSQLRLPGNRKGAMTQGTPNKPSVTSTKKEKTATSSRRTSTSHTKKPLFSATSEKSVSQSCDVSKEKQTLDKNLTTPVNRTPSRRIIARKLPTKDISSCGPSDELSKGALGSNIPVNQCGNDNKINDMQSKDISNTPIESGGITDETSESLDRLVDASLKLDHPTHSVDDTTSKHCNSSELSRQINESQLSANATQQQVEESAPLLDLGFDDAPSNKSPLKGVDYFLDPFQTGHTPPPLIDIGDVLQPEKPSEVLLIEF